MNLDFLNFQFFIMFSCSNLLRDVNKSTPLDYLGIFMIFKVLKWSDSQENDKHRAVIFWAHLLFKIEYNIVVSTKGHSTKNCKLVS